MNVKLGDFNTLTEKCVLCDNPIQPNEGYCSLIEQHYQDKGQRRYFFQHQRKCLDFADWNDPRKVGPWAIEPQELDVSLDIQLKCQCGNVLVNLSNGGISCQMPQCDHYNIEYDRPRFTLRRRT